MNIEQILAGHGVLTGASRGGGLIADYESAFTAVGGESNIPVNIAEFNSSTDLLQVHQNNLYLQSGQEYTINADGVSIDLAGYTANANDKFYFKVLKNVEKVDASYDGALLIDGSVTNAKLATDIKVGSLASLSTTAKSDVVSALNEVNSKSVDLSPVESKLREQDRLLANHEAIFDIDEKAIGNSGKIYDLVDGSNNLSAGQVDLTKTKATQKLVTTDSTNLFIPSHGLVTNDMIVNVTRSNANRIVTKVDVDYLTVSSVTGQTNGDTIKKYTRGTDATAEVGTTTTNITITSHGLAVGDYIINATRANALRVVKTVVDANNVTVDAVTGQIDTDTIQRYNWIADDIAEGLKVLAGVDASGNQTSKITNASDALKFKKGQEVTILDDVATENVEVTRAESLMNTVTNTATDKTVVSSAYTTNKNARPQVLDNGWVVSAEIDRSASPYKIYLQVDKQDGKGFNPLCYLDQGSYSVDDPSLSSKGNFVFMTYQYNGSHVLYQVINAETQTNTNVFDGSSSFFVDSGQSTIDSVSLAISPDKTTLLASFSTKNGTYPNSFNIRSATGTINADNTVTWGTVEQLTAVNTTGNDITKPSVTFKSDGYPRIALRQYDGTNYYIFTKGYDGTSWDTVVVHNGGGYSQDAPDLVTDKNGVLLCAWHGKDATDTTRDNIRFSKSTDGGATWSAMEKLTSGNGYDKRKASITVNKSNKYFVLFWDTTQSAGAYLDIAKVENSGTGWSAVTFITSAAQHQRDPSTFYDNTFSLDFVEPLFIYSHDATKVGFYGTWNVIKEQFYLEVSALVNGYKKDADIARSTANYDTTTNRIEVGGWRYDTNYTRTDVSVIGSADTTSASSRPHMLSNGWLVSSVSVKDTVNGATGSGIEFHLSKDKGATWELCAYLTWSSNIYNVIHSTTVVGDVVHYIVTLTDGTAPVNIYSSSFNANDYTGTPIDTKPLVTIESQNDFDSVNLTSDENGILYGVASTKNGTYPNSFNARYYKSSDSGATWSVTQVTTLNTSGVDLKQVKITLKGDGHPIILMSQESTISTAYDLIVSYRYDGTSWLDSIVYNSGSSSYTQASPDAIFIPSTVSQSGSDEIHVSWYSQDSLDSINDIRHAISTDLGSTWTVTKIAESTVASSGYNYLPSITANKNGKVFVLYQNGSTNGASGGYWTIRKVENDGTGWTAPVDVTTRSSTESKQLPSTLFDSSFTLDFTEPLFIYNHDTIKVGFYGTWTETTKTALLNSVIRYNITPPANTTSEIAAWLTREEGDLTVTADLSIVDTLASESYTAMSKSSVQYSDGTSEDEFLGSVATAEEKVTLKLNLSRVDKAIKKAATKLLGAIG